MPQTSSAKKALRNSKRKELINKSRKYKLKQALKEFRRVLSEKPSEYKATLSKVFSALDKGVKNNIIPKSRASRKKSRLAGLVNEQMGAVSIPVTKEERKARKATTKPAPKAKKTPAKKAAVKETVKTATKTATKKPAAKKTATKKVTPAK
jgi:ribosomal protein S20